MNKNLESIKLLLIIQARSGSKRFKNKVLYPIYEIPLIQHVVNRVKKSKKITNIVVATSTKKNDDKLIKYLRKNKVNFFRGELDNVALRLYEAAKFYKKKFFIRISGDSPLIDYRLIDRAIDIIKNSKNKYDLVTNVFPRTFPQGQSVEIIKTSIIEKNIHKFTKTDKEHVTNYFYKNYKNFKIKNFSLKTKKNKMNLSVDTKHDLKRILKKFNKDKFENFRMLG